MRFSSPEFSTAFKLLNTFSDLSYDRHPCPLFKKHKKKDYYTCKHIPNVRLKLQEKIFKGYKGIILEIRDLLDEKIMRSKFIKADFTIYDNRNGFIDFNKFSIKSLDEFYPNFNGKIASGFHYCSFGNSKKDGVFDITITPDVENKYIRIGMFGAFDLTKKDFKAFNIKSILEQEYQKLWKEEFKKANKYLKV